MLNNLLQMRLKLLQKKGIQKTAESAGDLLGNKTTDKITRVPKFPPHNNSETSELNIFRTKMI